MCLAPIQTDLTASLSAPIILESPPLTLSIGMLKYKTAADLEGSFPGVQKLICVPVRTLLATSPDSLILRKVSMTADNHGGAEAAQKPLDPLVLRRVGVYIRVGIYIRRGVQYRHQRSLKQRCSSSHARILDPILASGFVNPRDHLFI
jgi:hypothetical protein